MSWSRGRRAWADQEGKEGASHLFLTTASVSWVPRAGWGTPIPLWGGLGLEGRWTDTELGSL